MVHVEETVAKDSPALREFQQRFLRGQPQLDPVFAALADVLLRLWDHYQSLCANSIVSSVFQFMTYSCVEPELDRLPLINNAQRFPWFMRERIGISEACAFMTFPNTRKLDIMQYLRAIPDMIFWIDGANDLLSSVF
jgi:Trichodiene synthase (TRI5)